MIKEKLHLNWDYLGHGKGEPNHLQEDWDMTLITSFNRIGLNIGVDTQTKVALVNPKLKPLIENLIYYKNGMIANKYIIEFTEEQQDYVIDIYGNTITISNYG